MARKSKGSYFNRRTRVEDSHLTTQSINGSGSKAPAIRSVLHAKHKPTGSEGDEARLTSLHFVYVLEPSGMRSSAVNKLQGVRHKT